MSVAAGTRLGAYEILALLGAGGMGQVYLATDTGLKRQVALKVLPPELANDAGRAARFQREAEVLASLNHQNIAHLYGVERSNGTLALAMELVEGDTLADRIAQGPIPLDEALPIARQIGEALEAAHEHGIVHRDLKPANIKIREDGTVKVLDFGLAKALESTSGGQSRTELTNSPTITSPALMTGVGMLIGTVAYMSPEQAKARPADKRSDIWSFGCVLYEMLTARRAFQGEDVSETLASVMTREPDWSKLPKTTPPSIVTVLQRSLQKDRRRRLADIADARLEFEDLASSVPNSDPSRELKSRRGTRRGKWLPWSVSAVAVVMALALGAVAALRPGRIDTHVYRTSIVLPADVTLKYASANPQAFISLSPDGRQLAFLAERADGRTMLWIRPLDSSSARALPGTEDAGSTPTWSPDGYFVAFRQGRQLKKIDTRGGPPVPIWSLPDGEGAIAGIAWNRDGVILLGNGPGGISHGILRTSADGATASPVLALDSKNEEFLQAFPAFLPDGRHFLYSSLTAALTAPRIYVASLDADDRKLLIDGASLARYAQGYLLFNRERTVFAQPFDADRLQLRGSPVPLAEQIAISGVGSTGWGAFSASDNGVLAYWNGNTQAQSRIEWMDRSGKRLNSVGNAAVVETVRLSPDGTRAVAGIMSPENARDLWIYDLARGIPVRFTFDGALNLAPIWSPDNAAVLLSKRNRGNSDLFLKSASGAGTEQLVLSDRFNKAPLAWSHDGRFVLYLAKSGVYTVPGDLYALPMSGDANPIPVVQSPFDESGGTFSNDDRWVAYSSNESGRFEVYATPFNRPGARVQISENGGRFPRWSPDGHELFFLGLDNMLMSATVKVGLTSVDVTAVRPLFQVHPNFGVEPGAGPYDVAPDGRFLVDTIVEQPAPSPITLVVNWTAGLKTP